MDYFRFTMRDGDPALNWCLDYWDEKQLKEQKDGELLEELTINTYRGMKSRHWFVGERNDGYIFEVTSWPAHDAVLECKQNKFVLKPTRLDMAADMEHDGELGRFTFKRRTQVRRHEKETKAKTKSTIYLVEAPGRGDSITIGTRKTGECLVNYDKDAEQGFTMEIPVERAESRTGRDRGVKVWQDILKCDNLDQFCLDMVVARYKLKGITLPIAKDARPYKYPSAYKPPTAEEQTAAWLINCAAKAFRRLKNENLRREVANAFGLGYRQKVAEDARLSDDARTALRALDDWREARLSGQREGSVKGD